ncbi:hypothetical protein [Bradyrhizobium sp. CSA112]|uniref:hypothetical protein n=1 Tax=Bradyrhizobium sp. CSA112 TaxID=2699170 RepID=UPI0023B1B143|nr:hypothetical protein [Bradyrhizobium sp. CSA112]
MVKVDTFNFTKYGLLHGKVVSVSQDAVMRDKPAGHQAEAQRQAGQTARSSEPPGLELIYAARVALDQTRMQVEDRMVDLAPGMAVTVEIKTGQRRIIEYLLSPLRRYTGRKVCGRGDAMAKAPESTHSVPKVLHLMNASR